VRIGIISDTHDNLPMIAKASAALRERGIEHLIHGGDFVAPFAVKALAQFGVPVTAVYGNNDGEKRGIELAFEGIGTVGEKSIVAELDGRRIVVIHEPMLLSTLVAAGQFDLCVYGHTHEVDIRREPGLIANPGEACGYVQGIATVVCLDLATMTPEVITLSE